MKWHPIDHGKSMITLFPLEGTSAAKIFPV